MVKMASAPHSGLSVARHLAWLPPPHSSEKRILLPPLLNVAECQYEKLESETAPMRVGRTGSATSRDHAVQHRRAGLRRNDLLFAIDRYSEETGRFGLVELLLSRSD